MLSTQLLSVFLSKLSLRSSLMFRSLCWVVALVHAGACVSSRLHSHTLRCFLLSSAYCVCVRGCLLLCQSNCTLGGGCETPDTFSIWDWCVFVSANYRQLCAVVVVMRCLLLWLSDIISIFLWYAPIVVISCVAAAYLLLQKSCYPLQLLLILLLTCRFLLILDGKGIF